MYVCLECYNTFTTTIEWEEKHGFNDPPYEHCIGSPCCSGAYTEAYRCDCCDDWITGSYIKTNAGERFCENCCIQMELGDE